MTDIRFGTDGWRAIMGEDFTPENVEKVIQAFCDFQKESDNRLLFVGYDRRKDSDKTAELVANVLASNGFDVRLAHSFCPTPCISWLVKANQALAGVMVTASHNPPQWNGIKFKESYGGAASPTYTGKIEDVLDSNDRADRKIEKGDFAAFVEKKRIQYFDPAATYVTHLKKFIDIDRICESNFKIVVDPLFGAGTGFVEKTLGQSVVQIHDAADPNFGGLNPEPIDKNLNELKKVLLQEKADIGLATDGDADRIGAYDEKGNFVSSHQIFSLLLRHNLMHRKLTGPVVKSISTTRMIDKICQKHELDLTVTPIGFKHISQELLKQNALMGGEESGGISLREHVHERDGVLNGLLLLEAMAVNQKPLSQLITEMENEYGRFCFQRDDYHLTDEKIETVKKKVLEPVAKVGGVALLRTEDMDGMQYLFEDESWLLVRASGTEPLLRVYAEGPSEERVSELLGFAKAHFGI